MLQTALVTHPPPNQPDKISPLSDIMAFMPGLAAVEDIVLITVAIAKEEPFFSSKSNTFSKSCFLSLSIISRSNLFLNFLNAPKCCKGQIDLDILMQLAYLKPQVHNFAILTMDLTKQFYNFFF